MADLENICLRAYFTSDQLAALRLGDTVTVTADFGGELYAVASDNMFSLLQAARTAEGVKECYPFGDTHHLVADEEFSAVRFAAKMQAQGVKNLRIGRCEPTIEDVFIKLMQR